MTQKNVMAYRTSFRGFNTAKPEPNYIKQKLFDYALEMKKNGRAKVTIDSVMRNLKALSRECNILNPDEVKLLVSNKNWANTTKQNHIHNIIPFYRFLKIEWQPPTYQKENKLPFIPEERELDTLINTAYHNTIKACLMTLKECGIRIGEYCLLKWIDLNERAKTLNITPEKGSNPRILKISNELLARLKQMPHNTEYITHTTQKVIRQTFCRIRNRAIKETGNPRLKAIHLHTFRHFRAVMEYHKTKDIMHVKNFLGHRSIDSTMVYLNVEKSLYLGQSQEFHVKTAKTAEEATKLIEVGFEYVTEMDNLKIFRKRK